MRGLGLGVAIFAAVLIGAGVRTGVASADMDIVVNGGFETGDFTGWTTNPAPNGGFPWAVVSTTDLGVGQPYSGTYYATNGCEGAGCLDPTSGAWLTQVLTPMPGQTYNLAFAYDPSAGGPAELAVQWGGSTVFDLATDDVSDPGYTLEIVDDLLATSVSTALTFLGRQDPSFDALDAVAVFPTPEPPTLVLFVSMLPGVIGVAAWRWRRPRAGVRIA